MKKIGLYGTGNFAVAIANLLAKNNNTVTIYSHRENLTKQINTTHKSSNAFFDVKISATSNIEAFVKESEYIFIITPSDFFLEAIKKISPYVKENHVVVHGIKGFFINWNGSNFLDKNDISTFSSIVKKNLKTENIAYISGPNLARELLENKPAATLVSSENFNLSKEICMTLSQQNFLALPSENLKEAELCGVLKNIYAIAIGYISHLGMNANGAVISKSLDEMSLIFDLFEYDKKILTSIAGIGDLIATAFSDSSRNASLGKKLAENISIEKILEEKKTYEGIKTIKAIKFLSIKYDLKLPIVDFFYSTIFKNYSEKDFFSKII